MEDNHDGLLCFSTGTNVYLHNSSVNFPSFQSVANFELCSVFQEMDEDGDGLVCFSQFSECLHFMLNLECTSYDLFH